MLCNLTTDILDQVLKKFVSPEKTKQNKTRNTIPKYKIKNKKCNYNISNTCFSQQLILNVLLFFQYSC